MIGALDQRQRGGHAERVELAPEIEARLYRHVPSCVPCTKIVGAKRAVIYDVGDAAAMCSGVACRLADFFTAFPFDSESQALFRKGAVLVGLT